MTIVATNKDFRIEQNKTGCFFVIDGNGACWKRYRSQSAAVKYMNKVVG